MADAARLSNDKAVRQPLYDKVVKQLQTDMPIAYLYFEPLYFWSEQERAGL